MSFLIGMAVVLAVLWVISFIVLHVAGALIHLLIVIAAVLLCGGFVYTKESIASNWHFTCGGDATSV